MVIPFLLILNRISSLFNFLVFTWERVLLLASSQFLFTCSSLSSFVTQRDCIIFFLSSVQQLFSSGTHSIRFHMLYEISLCSFSGHLLQKCTLLLFTVWDLDILNILLRYYCRITMATSLLTFLSIFLYLSSSNSLSLNSLSLILVTWSTVDHQLSLVKKTRYGLLTEST